MFPCRSVRATAPAPRQGAYLVEFSLVVPVFALFLVGIMEFGHVYMIIATINSAAKEGARLGGVDGVSTAEVQSRITQVVGSAINSTRATVYVKDATLFDADPLATNVDYSALPDLELQEAGERQLFVVRIEVPYNEVALLPPFWVRDFTLVGQSVMRHE